MAEQLRYEIRGTPGRFWEVFFDPEVTRALHLEALGSTSVTIEALVGHPATGVERIISYRQRLDAPEPVRRLFGGELDAVEHGRFDPATGVWSFTVTPGVAAEDADIRGSIEILEADPDGGTSASEMVFSLDARVRMVGAGPVVERFVERHARGVQDRAVAFLNAVLADGTRGSVGAGSMP